MSYKLNHEKFLLLAKSVHQKIEQRFASRGIERLAGKVYKVCLKASLETKHIKHANYWLRGTIVFVLALVAILFFMLLKNIIIKFPISLTNLIQSLDAGISTLIYTSAGLVLLLNLERKLRRKKALGKLNELRSLAHLIDIHQIHKDPELILSGQLKHSSGDPMSAQELSYYYNYCSELLMLLGKVATIYVQDDDDPATITAANEIESLVNDLSRKVWQKNMLLHQLND